MSREQKLPELLAPAGSFDALRAAVAAGADAVYFGAHSFNARKNATNFTEEELREAIRYCHCFGVKTHLVLNTQLYGKEISDALRTAETVAKMGVDAWIVADLGLASLLKRYFPEVPLHASTQACGQNLRSAQMLASLGFSRMVAARELPLRDIVTLCKESPIETEIFVHGALCVCHSGQCLMSAVIGGRSGNRGECAQPCRLPYQGSASYPLSLKDLSLATHIPQIIDSGVDSLKIEGRMKSPSYVYGVTSVYRRLLDERRAATAKEVEQLSHFFSRSGFTDGYFTEKIFRNMLGVRTETDKNQTSVTENGSVLPQKTLPLHLFGRFLPGMPCYLHGEVMRCGEPVSFEVTGRICDVPVGAGTPAGRIEENLRKLGGTIFSASDVVLEYAPVFLPLSEVNALRRALCEGLEKKLAGQIPQIETFSYEGRSRMPNSRESKEKSAFFSRFSSLSARAIAYFDRIFLPLDEYLANAETVRLHSHIGISLPPVAFDHELAEIDKKLQKARANGCRHALISGLWQADSAARVGFVLHGDLRLNVFHAESAAIYEKYGFASLIASPEVGIPAMQSFSDRIPIGYILYGRLPLMTLEKCVIRDTMPKECPIEACNYCKNRPYYLKDRTGAAFPVFREWVHRNVLYNSVPIYMADKLVKGLFSHCIFTDESHVQVDAIVDAIEAHMPPRGKFKRL